MLCVRSGSYYLACYVGFVHGAIYKAIVTKFLGDMQLQSIYLTLTGNTRSRKLPQTIFDPFQDYSGRQ